MMNRSEVARLLGQIQTEYQSAVLGLAGLSQGTCQHKIITAKTERIAICTYNCRRWWGTMR